MDIVAMMESYIVAFIQRTGVRDEESIVLYVYKRNVYHGV